MRGWIFAAGVCALVGAELQAGWPKWWATHEDTIPGARQKYYGGKRFPPQPRPVDKPAPLVHQYHYAHYWPYPLVCDDRALVRAALDAQAGNGWMVETTLHDGHFDPLTQSLNSSGKMHLRWILLHTPTQYRTAYVAAGDTPEISQTRLAAVQAAASEITDNPQVANVVLRNAGQMGTSAQQVDIVGRRWLSTIPSPRIAYKAGSGSGSSAGGSGGGGGSGQP